MGRILKEDIHKNADVGLERVGGNTVVIVGSMRPSRVVVMTADERRWLAERLLVGLDD